MKRHLTHKETKQFWIIETQENSHTINEGTIGEEGTFTTTEFRRSYEIYDDVRKRVKTKFKEGYEFFVKIPDNLFSDLDGYQEDEKGGPFILVDFDNKAEIAEKMDKALQYVKAYLNSGIRSVYNIDDDIIFFREKKTGEKTVYESVDFFERAFKLYPDLEEKLVEWLDFAISIQGVHTDYGKGSYLFEDVALTLLNHDKKHIDRFLAYLHTWDWDHETDDESYIFEHLIGKYGATSDESLKVIAARRLSLAGQHGSELELDEYFEDVDEKTLDRFFQFMMLDLLVTNRGKENKRLTDPNHKAHHQEAKQTVEYYIEGILTELGIGFDKDRMIMAVANIDRNNPYKLSDILNPNYKIPLSAPFCITLGHKETANKNYPESIAYFSRAIEKDPNPSDASDAFLGRGFAHYCANDMKNAELDWLKTIEVNPKSITANRNLIEIYNVHLPNYPKALHHANQLMALSSKPNLTDFIHRGSIYELMGDTEKAEQDYQKGLTSTSISDHLTYVELKIIFNQFEKAYQTLQNKEVINDQKSGFVNYFVIAQILECITLIGLNKDYKKEKKALEQTFKDGAVYNKWSFQVIENWLDKGTLNPEQTTAIKTLISFVEENRSTNY